MLEIMIPFKITEDFIESIVCTAFEGGSNYWIISVENATKEVDSQYFSECIAKGDKLVIIDEDLQKHEINAQSIAEGYKMYVENCLKEGYTVYSDPCDIDGGIADEILQYAVFKEVIFG